MNGIASGPPPGLQRIPIASLADGGEVPITLGVFDQLRLLTASADAGVQVAIGEGGSFFEWQPGQAWVRAAGEPRPRGARVRNASGAALTSAVFIVSVGGVFADDRLVFTSDQALGVRPGVEVASTAIAHDSTTAPATTTALVAAAGGVQLRLVAGLCVWSDGAPGSYALLRTTAGRPILASYGGAVQLPHNIDLPLGEGLEIYQTGRATVYGTRGTV